MVLRSPGDHKIRNVGPHRSALPKVVAEGEEPIGKLCQLGLVGVPLRSDGEAARSRRAECRRLTAGIREPPGDVWCQVRFATMTGPDHRRALSAYRGNGRDEALDVGVVDVPEDPGQQQHVCRRKIAEHARNEAFDARNYAQAALLLLKPDFDAIEKRLKSMPSGGKNTLFSHQKPVQKRTGCINKGVDS